MTASIIALQGIQAFCKNANGFIEKAAEIEEAQTLLEIGAGAKIHQTIHADANNLEHWQNEPAGFIYVNYCDEDTSERILSAGKRQEASDGFLSGLNIKES
jgi:hypothetical protein